MLKIKLCSKTCYKIKLVQT